MKSFSSRIALTLCFFILVQQFAHAAKLPRLHGRKAQQTTPSTAPPIQSTALPPGDVARTRLAAAKNIFISDDGSDDAFPESPGLGHDRFVSAMRSWGRYNIVSTIAEADLVLQLRSAVTTSVVDGTADSPSASVYHNPFFRLTLAEPSNLKPLWVVTVPVQTGIRKKDKADLFAISAENMTSQLKLLVDEPLTSKETAQLRTVNAHHSARWVLIPVAAVVTAGFLTGILMKRNYDNNVANQNAALCKQNPFFCTAH